MADTKFSALDAAGVLDGTEIIPIIKGGLPKRTNPADIVAGSQPLDTDLTTLAGLTPTNNDALVYTSGAWANRSMAQFKTTAALNNVSNTNDASKPVSTAQQTALNLKADLASPAFTGTPTGIVIIDVKRQNDTSNTTVTGARIESGWGVFAQGEAANKSETVTFNTAFTSIPIITISYGGDQTGGTIALGNGGNVEKGPVAIKAYGESTTAFTAHAHTTDGTAWSATANVYYKWMAIGA